MRFLRVLLGVALAVAVFEPLARLTYRMPMAYDPVLGPVPQPGAAVRWCIEGCGTSHWQEHGLRRARPPDPALPVILAVGDSLTEALQVDDDQTFAARLESQLDGFQVLNVGHSAFSTADYLGLAAYYQETWHPRWTIITLKEEDLAGVEHGLYRLTRDGGGLRAVTEPHRPPGRISQFLGSFAMFKFGLYRCRQLRAGAAAEPPLFHAGDAVVEKPVKPVASPEEILGALDAAYAGRVTFVFLPRLGAGALPGPPELAFERACAVHHCVNLRARFAALWREHRRPYGFANSVPGTGHLNPAGHAAVADAVRAELAGHDLF